jgi:hypothetical protein
MARYVKLLDGEQKHAARTIMTIISTVAAERKNTPMVRQNFYLVV